MNAQKQTESTQGQLPATERKPWKKKSPVEVVLDQIERVRDNVSTREEELKAARRELQKLEEVKKLLEAK
jgi:hypothetical protein